MGQIGTSEKTETKNHIVLSDNHTKNLISWLEMTQKYMHYQIVRTVYCTINADVHSDFYKELLKCSSLHDSVKNLLNILRVQGNNFGTLQCALHYWSCDINYYFFIYPNFWFQKQHFEVTQTLGSVLGKNIYIKYSETMFLWPCFGQKMKKIVMNTK